MWCPTCGSEYREGIVRCDACGVDLVIKEPDPAYSMETGPLTGRPVADEIGTTGPVIAGSFVSMEEAHAALRALSDAGISGEVTSRDEQFPMTISGAEPALGISVAPLDLPKAREVLRAGGLLPVVVARFRREADAHAALAALEARGLKPRISTLMLDEIPAEFREDMEAYILEVPAEQEAAASGILEKSILRACESCGAQIQPGDAECRTCGEPVAV